MRKITIEITVDISGMSDHEIQEFYIAHFKRASNTTPVVKVEHI